MRKFSILSDFYFIFTLRVGRCAILRLEGTGANSGAMLRSRARCHIATAISCVAVGLSEFP